MGHVTFLILLKFFFLALMASSKVEEIMIFGVIIWLTVTCQPLNRAHSWEVVALP